MQIKTFSEYINSGSAAPVTNEAFRKNWTTTGKIIRDVKTYIGSSWNNYLKEEGSPEVIEARNDLIKSIDKLIKSYKDPEEYADKSFRVTGYAKLQRYYNLQISTPTLARRVAEGIFAALNEKEVQDHVKEFGNFRDLQDSLKKADYLLKVTRDDEYYWKDTRGW